MIIVTGATGKTGRDIVKLLAGRGVPVRALVRNRAKAADLEALHAEIAVGDLAAPATLLPALRGVETAYLLTAGDPQQVVLHSNFIRAAKQAGVKHIVRHSARGADPNSPTKLGRWHAASLKEESGIAWTHLQPTYYMQNFLMFAPTIRTEGVFYAPMKNGSL